MFNELPSLNTSKLEEDKQLDQTEPEVFAGGNEHTFFFKVDKDPGNIASLNAVRQKSKESLNAGTELEKEIQQLKSWQILDQ